MTNTNDSTSYNPVDVSDLLTSCKKEEVSSQNKINSTAKNSSSIVPINMLQKRVCYFSLAGDWALKAFEENFCDSINEEKKYSKLRSEITQRLYFAIVMFDIVVVHCSDPLRSTLIKEIFYEHIKWVEEGRICFIASNDITDWKRDYATYIDRKRAEYQTGFFAELEANSLQQPHINEEYMQSVKELLAHSPYYIRKESAHNCQFTELLKEDIKHKIERIVICLYDEQDTLFANIKRFAVEKTVYQLLCAQYYKSENNNIMDVFDQEIVTEVFGGVRKALQKKQIVARPAIVEAIKEKVSKRSDLQEAILDAITLRMDLLYCRMNAGKHLILEFHPSYEDQTIYKLECFRVYLKKFNIDPILTMDIVENMLKSERIDDFRRVFLASMADTQEQSNFTMKLGNITSIFSDRCKRLLPSNGCNFFS